MKKFILTNLILLTLFLSFSFADMKDNFYCTISADSIVVSLEKQDNYKCTQYIMLLSQAINKEYKDILGIQGIIRQGYDIDFWFSIIERKRDNIKKILLIKDQIEKSLKNFDENFFQKTKEYLVFLTSPYYSEYNKILNQLKKIDEKFIPLSIKNKIVLLQEQILVIENIIFTMDYDSLIKNFNKYVYLKNQIEGK